MMQRWNQHVLNAKTKAGKGCAHFWNAIRKYGKYAFSHEVLEVCYDLEVVNLAEKCWIEFHESTDSEKGFNLVRGGAHTPHPIKNPWDRPEYRIAAIQRSRKLWSDPILRARASANSKALHQNSGYAKNKSLRTKEQRKNQDIASRTSASMKKVWRDPDFRSKYESLWSDSSYRARSSVGLEAFRALQKSKTHCPVGHEYTPENTYMGKKGDRNCRICHRLKTRLRRSQVRKVDSTDA